MNRQTANYKGQKNPNGVFIDNPDVIPPAGNRLVSALSKQQGKFAAAGGFFITRKIIRKFVLTELKTITITLY